MDIFSLLDRMNLSIVSMCSFSTGSCCLGGIWGSVRNRVCCLSIYCNCSVVNLLQLDLYFQIHSTNQMCIRWKKGAGCTLLDSFTLIIQEQDRDSRRTWRNFSLVWEVSRKRRGKKPMACLSALGIKVIPCCSESITWEMEH